MNIIYIENKNGGLQNATLRDYRLGKLDDGVHIVHHHLDTAHHEEVLDPEESRDNTFKGGHHS